MTRTTITLKDDAFKSLGRLAAKENRSTPNLIETILLRHLDEGFYADEAEMAEINRDPALRRDLKRGLADYRARRGRFA